MIRSINRKIKRAASLLSLIMVMQLGYGQSIITTPSLLKQDLGLSSLQLDTLNQRSGLLVPYRNSIMFQTDLLSIHQGGLGIFCKAEDKLSAKAPVQFRFRLGGLDYVNRLEGKY